MINKEDLLKRIVVNPKVMVGQPVVKGTRLTVDLILGLLAHGWTNQEILTEYPSLNELDIMACILFAQENLKNSSFMPLVFEAC